MVIQGARQVVKSFIIRHVGKKLFENYIEINLLDDLNDRKIFQNIRNINDFYLQIGSIAGTKIGKKENTLIFLDEIQAYPHILTMLKFLVQDNRFTYIASGSVLGVTLQRTISIPIGSIQVVNMYPLDFEEFLWANNMSDFVIETFRGFFNRRESLNESFHEQLLGLFRKYLLVGGLPACVQSFVNNINITEIREIQSETHRYYATGIDP